MFLQTGVPEDSIYVGTISDRAARRGGWMVGAGLTPALTVQPARRGGWMVGAGLTPALIVQPARRGGWMVGAGLTPALTVQPARRLDNDTCTLDTVFTAAFLSRFTFAKEQYYKIC